MKDSEQTLPNTNQSKKRYQRPLLQVYGDLGDITQAVLGTSQHIDNFKGLFKTH